MATKGPIHVYANFKFSEFFDVWSLPPYVAVLSTGTLHDLTHMWTVLPPPPNLPIPK